MANKYTYPGIDSRIKRIIAQKTRSLAGRHGITLADLADIKQDLHIKVDLAQLDPEDDFFERNVRRIVNNAVVDLIRFREYKCRDWRQEAFSLDSSPPDDEDSSDPWADILDLSAAVSSGFCRPAEWHGRRETAADVRIALAKLPNELRTLAVELGNCKGNLSEAARSLGLGRKKSRILFARLKESLARLLRN